MPDVTPKTESGRALLDGIENPMRPVPLNYASTADAILAIEQEAASVAVAEVLDRLDGILNDLDVRSMDDLTEACTDLITYHRRKYALIASERER